ncbi:MAG: SPOR domain-containing protein [Pseudomonadales bacterium]
MRLAYQPPQPLALTDLPGDFYAVQLLAMSSKEALERFVAGQSLQGLSAARVVRDGRFFYVLLLGIYETRERAQQASRDLPPPFDRSEPWVRRLSSLQDAMRAADALAGSRTF